MAEFRDLANLSATAIQSFESGQIAKARQMQNKLAQMQLAQAPAQMQRQATADALRNRLLAMQVQEAEAAPGQAKQAAEQKRMTDRATVYQEWMGKIANAYQQVPDAQKEEVLRVGIDQMGADMSTRGLIQSPKELLEVQNQATQAFGAPGAAALYGSKPEAKPAYSKDLTVVRAKNPNTGKMEDRFAQVRGDGGVDSMWDVEVPEDRDQALKEMKFQMEQKEKQQAALNSVTAEIDQAGLMVDQAKLARDRTDWTSTGWFAQFTSGLGGTPASELGALVDSIKAKLGFEELRKMRAQSPTGGALGQVTEKELTFLQSVIENLDPERVGPAEFKRKLDNVISRFQRIQRLAQMERDILSGGQFNQEAFDQLEIDPRAEEQVDNLLKVVSGQQGESDMALDDALKMYGD